MFGGQWISKSRQKDEAEKPFWISYADLMTALMMLFLIVMCVALMSMIDAQEGPEKEREQAIEQILKKVDQDMQKAGLQGSVNVQQRLISFGDQARFGQASSAITEATAKYLRGVVPIVLQRVQENTQSQKWFKRVTVEGYTSQEGTYFYNLDLSLRRAQNVLCALLGKEGPNETPLTDEQKLQIRRIFMVGGFSANSTTGDPTHDRRVEFRLEFWTVQEQKEGKKLQIADGFDQMEVGTCHQQ